MATFGSERDLVARLSHALRSDSGRPLAVLCGSGITQPVVPGAGEIIRVLRRGLDKDDQADLDDLLASIELDADKYQAAFRFLSFRRPPEFREQVVRMATLRACTVPTDHRLDRHELADRESHVDNWSLTPAVAALGRMWAGLPISKRGPILTTNFDPLLEISVRKAGGDSTTYIQADDSSFLSNLRVQTGTSVVHLHGFWRESSTLHTPEQLELDRPSVGAAIQAILEESTLLVIGYGAWSDVFTKQLAQVVGARNGAVDVLWCMLADDELLRSQIEANETLRTLTDSNAVQVYSGIDANRVLPALEQSIDNVLQYRDAIRENRTVQSVVGWTTLSVDSVADAADDDARQFALTFFDGREPGWGDIANPFIPIRDAAITVTNELAAQLQGKQSSMRLIIGPSGEGKSTLLRQVAYKTLRRDASISVLLLEGEQLGSIEALLALPEDKQHILLIDDADEHITKIETLVGTLQAESRRGIHLVVAARDTDWRRRGGFQFNWGRHVSFKTTTLRGLSHLDAESIVTSWERLGRPALKGLSDLRTHEARVEALLAASSRNRFSQATVADDGSLLGCLLEVRYGTDLVEHVRLLMSRLSDRFITTGEDGDATLVLALVAIAIPHANNVYSLTFDVLARSLGVEVPTLIANVLAPLGDEAAVSYSSNRATIRHSAIARAVCDLAPEFGVDLATVCSRLVAAAAQILSRGRADQDVREIAYLARKLRVHSELKVPAARAATEVSPARLSYWTTLSAALRDSNLPEEAVEVNHSVLDRLATAEGTDGVRGFLVEWGVAEGMLTHFAENTFLAAIALSDFAWLERLNRDSAEMALSCLTYGLRRLHQTQPNAVFFDGLAACAMLSEALGISDSNPNLPPVLELLVTADALDGALAMSLEAGCESLTLACAEARRSLRSELPAAFPKVGEARYKALAAFIERESASSWLGGGYRS